MKKFFIPLVLIFSFLVCVPQSVLAALYPPKIMEKIEQGKEKPTELKKTYSSCLKKHKSKLPKEYKGFNLKFEDKRVASSDVPYVVENRDVTFWFTTDNEYFIDVHSNGTTNTLRRKSMATDCSSEYIAINDVWPPKSINLIDVPVGSHLKYIPETDEMQVLPPKKDSKYITDITILMQTITELSKQIEEGLKIRREKDLKCFYDTKSQITIEYVGPNLSYYSIKPKIQRNDIEKCYKTTENKYFINLQDESSIEVKSQICGCQEYVFVSIDKDNYYAYNVINVPLFSTLKYIPKTREMQVFSPTKESIEKGFEEEIKKKDKLMCLYNKKLNLPQKYKGPNLKFETDIKNEEIFSTGLNYSYKIYHPTKINPQLDNTDYSSQFRTTTLTGPSVMFYNEKGCNEYKRTTDYKYFNVTNIPPTSQLNPKLEIIFVPNKNFYKTNIKEIEVLPVKDNNYNQYIKAKIRDIENKEKEYNDSVTTGDVKLMIEKLEDLKLILDEPLSSYINLSPKEREEKRAKFKNAAPQLSGNEHDY